MCATQLVRLERYGADLTRKMSASLEWWRGAVRRTSPCVALRNGDAELNAQFSSTVSSKGCAIWDFLMNMSRSSVCGASKAFFCIFLHVEQAFLYTSRIVLHRLESRFRKQPLNDISQRWLHFYSDSNELASPRRNHCAPGRTGTVTQRRKLSKVRADPWVNDESQCTFFGCIFSFGALLN